MKGIRSFRKGFVASIFTLSIFSPFSISIASTSQHEQNLSKRNLAYYSTEDAESLIENFKIKKQDDSILKEQKYMNNGQLNVKSKRVGTISEDDNATDLAFYIKDVEKSSELREHLKLALSEGKMVYIYGGLTYEEYAQLLGLDNLTVDVASESGKSMELKMVDKKDEKHKVKQNSLNVEGEDTHDIIGYTLSPDVTDRLFVSDINVTTKNGKINPNNKHYMQEILSNLSTKIENSGEATEKSSFLNLLKENKAKATPVASIPAPATASAYWNDMLIGRIITAWSLDQGFDEKDSKFDYFTVKDNSQILSYNGCAPNYYKEDHDIPRDIDKIYDWDPGDDSSSPYQIGIEAPWAISYGFELGGDPNVEDIGSVDNDYGRWEIKNGLSGSLKNGDRFRPATAWYSAGTYATMDIRTWGKFSDPTGLMNGEAFHKVDVNFEYNTGTWVSTTAGWKFKSYYTNDWVYGWAWDDNAGKWYYLDIDTGIMKTGWLKLNSTWYYLDSSGAMAIGWKQVGGTWYYFKSNGAMATGWINDKGTWYYLNSDGSMHTGWLSYNGYQYYLSPNNGAMVIGNVYINGVWYYFDETGKMS